MSIFLKSGNSFKVTPKEKLDIHEKLPVGTYSVKFNGCTGQFFLEKIDSFDVKGKLYGNINRVADRILKTFSDRKHSTGVLLSGEKGSGKTMLAKKVSTLAATQLDIPTFVVNQSFCGETFNQFMQMICQPSVVIFDEFEKVYSKKQDQESLLTLLDGVFPSKKLYIFTSNNKWKLNENMQNRPGRIFYSLDYEGLDQDFIQEYCEDLLLNKDHVHMVCSISQVFSRFNFDMLKGLVEEMNRYNETPSEALKFLNAQPDFNFKVKYQVQLVIDDKLVNSCNSTSWYGNPLKDVISIGYYKENEENNDGSDDDGHERTYTTVKFTAKDFHNVHSRSGAYTFVKKKQGQKLILKPFRKKPSIDFGMLERTDKILPLTPPVTDSDSESEYE